MGYETWYSLDVHTAPSVENISNEEMGQRYIALQPDMEAFCDDCKPFILEVDREGKWHGTVETKESWRWYDHEVDLIAFSKQHPEWEFTLGGDGEDGGDWWEKDFWNGKIKRRYAVLPSYDDTAWEDD